MGNISSNYGGALGKHGLGPAEAASAELGDPGTGTPAFPLRSVDGAGLTGGLQTETLFQTYSQFSQVPDIPPQPTEEEKATEAKLEEILEKVSYGHPPLILTAPSPTGTPPLTPRNKRDGVIAKLTRLLDSETTLTSSALKQNNLSLLRDKLASHKRDLARLRTSLSTARDRANLLSNIHSDIDQYRAANPAAAEAEYMLEERDRIDGSHRMADSVLSQAYAVNENFMVQRETLANVNRRITAAAGKVPGLNALIGRISAKKRRDGIIMGLFIAFCFITFWWFL